jgi:hypothetical protein
MGPNTSWSEREARTCYVMTFVASAKLGLGSPQVACYSRRSWFYCLGTGLYCFLFTFVLSLDICCKG